MGSPEMHSPRSGALSGQGCSAGGAVASPTAPVDGDRWRRTHHTEQRNAAVSNVQPSLGEPPPPTSPSDGIARYRLWSESPMESADTWEVQWQPLPPADGPPSIRRSSRQV